ncbi:hypothetical protein Tco_0917956, partial [Tanacetum coccineum]
MCMRLKDHLNAKERKQDKCPLETPLDFEECVFDDEVQQNEVIPLSDEEIALDASSEGTMSPVGPRIRLMGLLLPLPQILRPEKSETVGGRDDTFDKEILKKRLVGLEHRLIHATIN